MVSPPTPEKWTELRPMVTRWYLSEQRTARWIEAEMRRNYGLFVTTKMLRDRFKAWNLQPKYNKPKARLKLNEPPASDSECRHSQALSIGGDLLGPTSDLSTNTCARDTATVESERSMLSRAPNTTVEDRSLTKTLKAVRDFFCNLTDNIRQNRLSPDDLDEHQALEVQRIAANAHQAAASQLYSSHRTFADLREVGERASQIIPTLNITSMHPRVLTALLRLIVHHCSKPGRNPHRQEEVEALKVIKALFEGVSSTHLFGGHPVSLLCSFSSDEGRTDRLLHYQINLSKTELYDKIRSTHPNFVALEEIYCARVLASLCYTTEAVSLLESVLNNTSAEQNLFIHADACRTMGFSKFKAGKPEQAIYWLNTALEEFRRSGNGQTDNVFFTHLALSGAYRELSELSACERSLWEALAVWKSNENLNENSSAVKLIRDLDQALYEQGKYDAQADLRVQFDTYFEDVRDPL